MPYAINPPAAPAPRAMPVVPDNALRAELVDELASALRTREVDKALDRIADRGAMRSDAVAGRRALLGIMTAIGGADVSSNQCR